MHPTYLVRQGNSKLYDIMFLWWLCAQNNDQNVSFEHELFFKSLNCWTCYPKPYHDELYVIIVILASISYLDVNNFVNFFFSFIPFFNIFFSTFFCVFGLHVLQEILIFGELECILFYKAFYGNISFVFKGICHSLMRCFVFREVFFIYPMPLPYTNELNVEEFLI
jgi:hypothetical protein